MRNEFVEEIFVRNGDIAGITTNTLVITIRVGNSHVGKVAIFKLVRICNWETTKAIIQITKYSASTKVFDVFVGKGESLGPRAKEIFLGSRASLDIGIWDLFNCGGFYAAAGVDVTPSLESWDFGNGATRDIRQVPVVVDGVGAEM